MDRTPMTPNGSSLGRGEELFAAHCAACHGAQGEGDGPAAAALETPPTSFLDLEHSDVFGPGEKYWIIKEGFPEAGMPGFEDRVGPADRWHLVNYIYHMQRRVRGGSGTHRPSDDRGHHRDGQLTDRHREFHPAAPQGGVPIPSE